MWLDNASDIDVLFYKPYVDVISEIARNKNYNPMTIGIFGLWGAGKSTLLKLIEDDLGEKSKNTVVIQINAWMFEGYEDAKIALMETLLNDLEQEKSFNGIKDKVKNLIKRVDFIKLGGKAITKGLNIAYGIASGNIIPLAFNLPNDITAVKKAVEAIRDSITETENSSNNSIVNNIRKFREEFESLLESSDIENLVVLIDDLDRCSPDRIIESLEAIKLFLSVNKITFIVAADENVIQYAINKRYPISEDSRIDLSKEYIEKMIQLPIYIPELSTKDIENYLLLLVVQNHSEKEEFNKIIKQIYDKKFLTRDSSITLRELQKELAAIGLNNVLNSEQFRDESQIIDSIRGIVSATLKGNPRQAKRFLNTFTTKRSLAKAYYGDEIDIKLLAKLLVLQKLNPELFNQLNEWNKDFDTNNKKFEKMYNSVMNKMGEEEYRKWESPTIKEWLLCEPQDISEILLDKYFYLTRENLKKYVPNSSSLSSEAKAIMRDIYKSNESNILHNVKRMISLETSEIEIITNVFVEKIKESDLEYYIIRELFVNIEQYREQIVEAILSANDKITPAKAVYLKAMLKCDTDKIENLVNELRKKARITKTIVDMVLGKGE